MMPPTLLLNFKSFATFDATIKINDILFISQQKEDEKKQGRQKKKKRKKNQPTIDVYFISKY